MEERDIYILPERPELKKVQAMPKTCETSRLKEALGDCCMRCLELERPYTWFEARGLLQAIYRCRVCGHEWSTWWDRDYILSRSRER
ncbi:MAG: hypothetical protein AB1374_04545 [Bacillota bacterium]